MHSAIVGIEEVKQKLQDKIDKNLKPLKDILRDDLETRADSEVVSDDEEEEAR